MSGNATISTPLRKRTNDQPCPTKKQKHSFVVGDYVCVHCDSLDKQHILCRIVQVMGKVYCLCCVLKGSFSSSELISLDKDCNIPLCNWRIANKVSLGEVVTYPVCVEACDCNLTQGSDSLTVRSDNWLCNSLYSLSFSNKEVLSPSGWLVLL